MFSPMVVVLQLLSCGSVVTGFTPTLFFLNVKRARHDLKKTTNTFVSYNLWLGTSFKLIS
jgi:hypothetical protein